MYGIYLLYVLIYYYCLYECVLKELLFVFVINQKISSSTIINIIICYPIQKFDLDSIRNSTILRCVFFISFFIVFIYLFFIIFNNLHCPHNMIVVHYHHLHESTLVIKYLCLFAYVSFENCVWPSGHHHHNLHQLTVMVVVDNNILFKNIVVRN